MKVISDNYAFILSPPTYRRGTSALAYGEEEKEEKMKKFIYAMVVSLFLVFTVNAFAGDTVAVFDFSAESTSGAPAGILEAFKTAAQPTGATLGIKVAEIVRSQLSQNPQLQLVERERISQMFSEMGLGKTGIVDDATAAKIGNLLGAKILVLGNCFVLGNNLWISARIIGVETSALFAETVKASVNKEIEPLAKELADKIQKVIKTKKNFLIAQRIKELSPEEEIAHIRALIGNKVPKVRVNIAEKRLSGLKIDPVVETEITYFLQKCGFEVVEGIGRADVEIEGSSFSEFATRRGDLISCKARVEVKAVDLAKNKILAVDREYATVVDIAEEIAATKALQKATQKILLRFIPEFVRSWQRK